MFLAVRKDRTKDGNMNLLECSSKGDRRFSAFYALLKIDNETKLIEEWYQTSKVSNFKASQNGYTELRPANDVHEGKGVVPSYITWKGSYVANFQFKNPRDVDDERSVYKEFYKMLWHLYLDQNPELKVILESYDGYTDFYADENGTSQAEAIRSYMDGESSLFLDEPLFCDCGQPKLILGGPNWEACSNCGASFVGDPSSESALYERLE